jgi:hypothetical protein
MWHLKRARREFFSGCEEDNVTRQRLSAKLTIPDKLG